MPFQSIKSREPDRTKHVWYKLPKGGFKCVLCGGLSSNPTDDCLPNKFEELTDEERDLCPNTIRKRAI